jgi:hypothetical protein
LAPPCADRLGTAFQGKLSPSPLTTARLVNALRAPLTAMRVRQFRCHPPKEKGLLAKVSVFETTSVTSSKPEVPAWNFVISSQLAEGANADSFVQAIEKTKGCENAAGVEVRRVERMRTTPNCNYARATAADDLKARESRSNSTSSTSPRRMSPKRLIDTGSL